jgi:hypothetical protein
MSFGGVTALAGRSAGDGFQFEVEFVHPVGVGVDRGRAAAQ